MNGAHDFGAKLRAAFMAAVEAYAGNSAQDSANRERVTQVAKLVRLPNSQGKQETLQTLEELRAAVERGDVAGFWGVTIGHDDSTHAWAGATVPGVTRLRGMGAVGYLLACMHSGDV